MNWQKKLAWGILIIELLAVNAGVGHLVYKSQAPSTNNQIITNNQEEKGCGEECLAAVREAVDNYQLSIVNLSATITGTVIPTVKPTAKPAAQQAVTATNPKIRSVQYVTIPGNGSTVTNGWTVLSGTEFYFDLGDYPGLKEIYFEANLKLFNGNGIDYARLYDSTHGIGVQGSEVQTSSQANTVVESGKLSFWGGKNLIKVQSRSLTADTAVYNSGRLRIVMEN